MTEIDFFPGLDQTEETIIFIVAGIIVLMAAWLFMKWSRRVRSSDAHMTVQELDKLKKKALLNEEEMARVRSAMARQYVALQNEEEERRKPKGPSGLEALAIEAERIEQGILPAKKESKQPDPLLPKSTPSPSRTEEPAEQKPVLPDNLKAYLGMSEFELEDALNAGFVTRDEMTQVLAAQAAEQNKP